MRRRDERHGLVDLLGRHLALRHRDVVVAPDRGEPAIERRLIHFFQQDGNAGVRVVHRNAAAHRAGADNRRAPDVPRRCVLRYVGNFGDFALGEEQMPQRPRFGGHDARREDLAFALGSVVEPVLDAGFDRLDGGKRRAHAARGLFQAGARRGDRVGRPRCVANRLLARLPDLPRLRLRLRERDRAREQIAVDNVVDDAGRVGLRRGHRLAVGAHVERHLQAGEPRQSLRAARAGDDAEQDLGLADLRVPGRDAEVARLRHLEPAAERVAVNRGDERLGRVFHAAQQRVRARGARERILFRLQRVEHLDVGAGDERRPGADEHDRFRRGIGDARAAPLHRSPSHTAGLSAFTGGLSIVTTATRVFHFVVHESHSAPRGSGFRFVGSGSLILVLRR